MKRTSDGQHSVRMTRTVIDAGPAPGRTRAIPAGGVTRPTSPREHQAPGASVTLMPGTRVEQFELIRELGRGGMGQVFLARDTKLGRLVALKFLGVQSAQLIERFLVEARATARCHHDNIVVIHEVNEWQDQPYMALEYLEGEPLSALLGGRRISPRRAVELMVPVVRALVRAHELDIVHRDLKPENIFVTRAGSVKVLDFGIAKIFEGQQPGQIHTRQRAHREPARSGRTHVGLDSISNAGTMTRHGAIVGTMPYMSPEQWGADDVDHRTDIWTVGIILWQMLTAGHPLDPVTPQRLQAMAAFIDEPMPRVESVQPEVPAELARIVDACLAKRKDERIATARALLDALELLLPARYNRRLVAGECPYPGMSAFQESDASRFFGRTRDIDHMIQRLREQPLVGVVGQSGIGKSSFVRAGVVPALKASDESWEVLVARPGRHPMASLAGLLQPLTRFRGSDIAATVDEHRALAGRLWREPGLLGTMLRHRARQKRGSIMLFVDQFEELYTLVESAEERRAYAACLAGAADDASTPLRVVLSMRSDLLDRVAEDRALMNRLIRGLFFLPPIDRAGMRAALVEPLELVGHAFEDEAVIDDMLTALKDTSRALPLLQFTAAKLWEYRDHERRLLTTAGYEALGRVTGALATHADELLAGLSPVQQRLTRAVFKRLVTGEGTRAITDVEELEQLAPDPAEVRAVLDHLVQGRLLCVDHGARDGSSRGRVVEIVHESLIDGWQTLRRWRAESAEDHAFLGQLGTAARQWDSKGRPVGLLWRGETMAEARRFHRRYKGELSSRERDYLEAVVAFAVRSARRRRQLLVGAFAFLSALVVVAVIALFWVRDAEQVAQSQRRLAEQETGRAQRAEAEIRDKLATIQAQRQTIETRTLEREEAEQKADKAERRRKRTYKQLESALKAAEQAKKRAEKTADENKKLAASERTLRRKAQLRIKNLEAEKKKLAQTLE